MISNNCFHFNIMTNSAQEIIFDYLLPSISDLASFFLNDNTTLPVGGSVWFRAASSIMILSAPSDLHFSETVRFN